jgi:hypothetical protein
VEVACVVNDRYIYTFGSSINNRQNQVWKFDTVYESWSHETDFTDSSIYRAFHSAIASSDGTMIYLAQETQYVVEFNTISKQTRILARPSDLSVWEEYGYAHSFSHIMGDRYLYIIHPTNYFKEGFNCFDILTDQWIRDVSHMKSHNRSLKDHKTSSSTDVPYGIAVLVDHGHNVFDSLISDFTHNRSYL